MRPINNNKNKLNNKINRQKLIFFPDGHFLCCHDAARFFLLPGVWLGYMDHLRWSKKVHIKYHRFLQKKNY